MEKWDARHVIAAPPTLQGPPHAAHKGCAFYRKGGRVSPRSSAAALPRCVAVQPPGKAYYVERLCDCGGELSHGNAAAGSTCRECGRAEHLVTPKGYREARHGA